MVDLQAKRKVMVELASAPASCKQCRGTVFHFAISKGWSCISCNSTDLLYMPVNDSRRKNRDKRKMIKA